MAPAQGHRSCASICRVVNCQLKNGSFVSGESMTSTMDTAGISESPPRRRLLAVLSADAVGYTRLMSLDDRGTVATLDAARAVFSAEVAEHDGRVIDMAGDSVLAVFETATAAVTAALAIQRQLAAYQAHDVPDDRRMRFRLGVHVGDVIEKTDGTVYGDRVNIAARLQGLAEAGGVAVSQAVQGIVSGRVQIGFVDIAARAHMDGHVSRAVELLQRSA